MSFMTRMKQSAMFHTALRVLQFLCATISLGLFSARLHKIVQQYGGATHSNGAVEGILAVALLFTLLAMLTRFGLKGGVANMLGKVWLALDAAFVLAFIIVAILTRPHDSASSGPCSAKLREASPGPNRCNLPWGTFILAIFSAIFHALTAAFHEQPAQYTQRHTGHKNGNYPNYANENGNNYSGGRQQHMTHGRHY